MRPVAISKTIAGFSGVKAEALRFPDCAQGTWPDIAEPSTRTALGGGAGCSCVAGGVIVGSFPGVAGSTPGTTGVVVTVP